MSAVEKLLRATGDYFPRRGMSVSLDASRDGFVVRRKVNGVVHRMFVDADLTLEAGASREDIAQSLERRLADFIWSTERPRVMTAGYCGTPRFLGRRCAI